MTLRGDNIPSVRDYAHWNEEAEAMWYAENRYDMENWDEPVDDDRGDYDDGEDRYDLSRDFTLRSMAVAFMDEKQEATLHHRPDGRWEVEWASDELIAGYAARRAAYYRGNHA